MSDKNKNRIKNSVSVCMATYNGENFIREQLDSILSQLKPGDELIVSDDFSVDNTLNILRSYGDKIKIVNIARVGGVVKNFEKTLSFVENNLVVLTDQDDVWLPGRLELVRNKLLAYDLIMMNADVVDENLISKNIDVFGFVDFHKGFLKNFLKPKYVGCCMAFKADILKFVMPFPSSIEWHDWYISLVAELLYRCEIIEEKTLLFRRHSNNNSITGMISKKGYLKIVKSRFRMAIAILITIFRFIRNR